MSTINPLSREVSAKIVYVGPGLSGKTSSLQYIHRRLNPSRRGELLSLATEEDRTLFFDFLPIKIPLVNGLAVRIQLYTVPGQVFYAATRELVLRGADGVVFVADSQRARHEANIESLKSMEEDLASQDVKLRGFPMVFQYNKRDLPGVLEVDELRKDLNPREVPEFETTATSGEGVLEALQTLVREVIRSLARPNKLPVPKTLTKAARETTIAQTLSSAAMRRVDPVAADAADSTEESKPPSDVPPPSSRPEDIVLIDEPGDQTNINTERPTAGVSFSALWEPSQRDPIVVIESCISAGRYHEAVNHIATALAHLLRQLPIPSETGVVSRAQVLGLDGHEYMQLCQLASQPKETIYYENALFALHVLVAARVKLARLMR